VDEEATAHPDQPGESDQPEGSDRRRKSLKTTAGDMVRSMVVVVGIVALLVLLVPRPTSVERPAIDVKNAASGAASQLTFKPSVPTGLPSGWVPTSATVSTDGDGVHAWLLVYRTPDGGYAGLRQAAAAPAKWENTQVGGAPEAGTRDVDGLAWVVRDGKATKSLVHRGAVTTVVITQGTKADVATLAAALALSS